MVHTYFHAAVPDVVVVLHAASERVPRRPVCRSVPEARSPDLLNDDGNELLNNECTLLGVPSFARF